MAALVLACGATAGAQVSTRISSTSAGMPASGNSGFAAVSASGRFVAFVSDAPDLVPGPAPAQSQVYVRDRQTGAIERASVGPGGSPENAPCQGVSISGDGRFVAFVTQATNLVAFPVANGRHQVYVRDRQTGATEMISINQLGQPSDADCADPSVSGDGRLVVYSSRATNLVPNSAGYDAQIYLRDRQQWATSVVSVSSVGAIGDGFSLMPRISPDGRFVVFDSEAWNLVAGDTNGASDVFVRDRQQGVTDRASLGAGGVQPDAGSSDGSISDDGRFVVFTSGAVNLVPGIAPDPWLMHVFVRDRQTGQIAWLSEPAPGASDDGDSFHPAISGDGRFAVFISETDLTLCSASPALYLADLSTGALRRADISPDETPLGIGYSSYYDDNRRPAISRAGEIVVFASERETPYYGWRQVFARAPSGCGAGLWAGASGGLFHTGANWCGGAAPGSAARASFKNGAPSTVMFATNPVIGSLLVSAGSPTLELGGHTLAALANEPQSVHVGAGCPDEAALTVRNGTLYARGGIIVGSVYPYTGSAGLLTVDGPTASLVSGGLIGVGSGYQENADSSALFVRAGAGVAADTLGVWGPHAVIDAEGSATSVEARSGIDVGGLFRARTGASVSVDGDDGSVAAVQITQGRLVVQDPGSVLIANTNGPGRIACSGALEILGGGAARASLVTDALPSYYSGYTGSARISGAGSRLDADRVEVGEYNQFTLTVEDGAVAAAAQFELGLHASVFGSGGALAGDVENRALFLPGDTPDSTGVAVPGVGSITVDGDLGHTLFGVLLLDLTLPGAGSAYDRVVITGHATLEGGLVAFAPPNFDPPIGAVFEILTCGSGSGEFGFVSLPTLPSPKYLRLERLPTGVQLRVLQGCLGDANGDNVVDFLDLNIVLGQYGQQGISLPADLNADGVVDFLDLNLILSVFGTTC